MESRYKVIISNKNLYKEIELAPDVQEIRVGTGINCDTRLHKDLFFEQIELIFTKSSKGWSVICSDNLYLTVGDVRKLMTKSLTHGDRLFVKYQESDNEVFAVDFLIDFDNGKLKYERMIDISNVSSVSIGGMADNNIVLKSGYIHNDSIVLAKQGTSLVLQIDNATYGVYHNGKKAGDKEKIENGDFFSIADYFFYYKDGKLYTEIRDDEMINSLNYADKHVESSYPKFNRNTRIRKTFCKEPIEILDPPAKPQKQKNNLLTRLMPAAMMIIMCVVMGMLSNGFPVMMIFSVASGVMGAVTAVIGVVQNKKDFKKQTEDRHEKYTKYIENKNNEIKSIRMDEKQLLDDIYLSYDCERENFLNFSADLFDRIPEDSDYLQVRLGIGENRGIRKINFKKQEKLEVEDELQKLPEQLYNEYKYIQGAPVVCSLKDINAMGIVGLQKNRYNIMKNIVIDICARQFQSDVKIFFIAEKKNKDKIHWLRMLPHVYNQETSIRNIVCDDESKNIMFEYLYKELTLRELEKRDNPDWVIFLYDEYGFKNHPISKFVKKAKELGVTFIFFGDTKADISLGCEYLIDIKDDHQAVLIDTNNSENIRDFTYSVIADEEAEKIVQILAPVYTEEISLEGSLTKNISMFKLLNIMAVDDIDLEKNWHTSQVDKSMAAPLGVSKNAVINLDLHDKVHGPHGLVAGTTGSGKSEILQTYILSMATLFHPYEVGFVIIDFKGGGMVNQFKDLPHLVGAITNIDGKEIDRSLKSIKAELQKRQRLFAEAEVNHIDKYIRKFKAGAVDIPIPHLILIVDEFAELKAEQPEFMKELISAARIGRSLGVHLILATQKPSGQVNEQIWSNSRFKLCLKVQDQEDSNEVLKSPLAAEIKEPGRAYLQVGNNEIFELFQSAYSGAPEKMDNSNVKEFAIYALNDSGRRIPVFEQKKKKEGGDNVSQLDAIVNYVHNFCEKNAIEKLPDICLPSLKNLLSCPNEIEVKDGKYPIGIYDDPDTQYQGNAYFNFDNDNTFIIGASQTGKTNLLQLVIREIATVKKANEVNFYIIDFGSMILKNFDSLNHVGGVVISSEEEKLKNLFKLLQQELDLRKEKLLAVGVSSISSYMEAGYKDIPHIYVLLDNFAVFKELYAEKYEDDFLFLAREGITYGISLIVTASTTGGFGYKYMSNFANHIALSCNDTAEYSNLFDRCKVEPNNTPGRMLISYNKAIYEAQSYLSFSGEKEIERVDAIRQFVEKENIKNNGMHAKLIPEVPDDLSLTYIAKNFNVDPSRQIAVSLSYQHVEPVCFDINATPQLALIGKNTSNMIGFEKALIHDMKENYFDRPAELFIIDSLTRDLKDYAEEAFVTDYSIDYSRLSVIFEHIMGELEDRYNTVLEDGLETLERLPLIVILINNFSAIEFISGSKELMSMYNTIVSKYKAMKIMMIFGGIGDENIGYSSPELLKKIKENKHAVIFSNAADHKVFDIPMPFIRQNKKPIDATQAYYLKENETVKIRFAKGE